MKIQSTSTLNSIPIFDRLVPRNQPYTLWGKQIDGTRENSTQLMITRQFWAQLAHQQKSFKRQMLETFPNFAQGTGFNGQYRQHGVPKKFVKDQSKLVGHIVGEASTWEFIYLGIAVFVFYRNVTIVAQNEKIFRQTHRYIELKMAEYNTAFLTFDSRLCLQEQDANDRFDPHYYELWLEKQVQQNGQDETMMHQFPIRKRTPVVEKLQAGEGNGTVNRIDYFEW